VFRDDDLAAVDRRDRTAKSIKLEMKTTLLAKRSSLAKPTLA
jgi:hypothetical protein